jgi:hypothetical protein
MFLLFEINGKYHFDKKEKDVDLKAKNEKSYPVNNNFQ